MIEKEWCFSGTALYIYDSWSIVLITFGKSLTVSSKRKVKTRNRLLTLTLELQREFHITPRQAVRRLKFGRNFLARNFVHPYHRRMMKLKATS